MIRGPRTRFDDAFEVVSSLEVLQIKCATAMHGGDHGGRQSVGIGGCLDYLDNSALCKIVKGRGEVLAHKGQRQPEQRFGAKAALDTIIELMRLAKVNARATLNVSL